MKKLRKTRFLTTFFSIFKVFWRFCDFGSILAQELNSFICKKTLIFWHPWDPWGHINSEVNGFWVHTTTVGHWDSNPWNWLLLSRALSRKSMLSKHAYRLMKFKVLQNIAKQMSFVKGFFHILKVGTLIWKKKNTI